LAPPAVTNPLRVTLFVKTDPPPARAASCSSSSSCSAAAANARGEALRERGGPMARAVGLRAEIRVSRKGLAAQ
jgi:hypothetical protein